MRSIILALLLAGACGSNDTNNTPKDAPAPQIDAGMSGPDASCFMNPTTHIQIINACTDAQKIYKNSHPALQGSDGSLPPLP